MVRFYLGPLLQGQMRIAKLKSAYNPLLLVLEVCNVKPTYMKSWARNLLMCSDLTLGPSSKVKRGLSKLKVLITHLLLVPEVCNMKPSYRKSWARNLLMWSHLTLDHSFKVKRGQPSLKVFITSGIFSLYVFYYCFYRFAMSEIHHRHAIKCAA